MKVWDYETKECVQTYVGYSHNVVRVAYHPHLSLIVSASEDGTITVWGLNEGRTLNYDIGRVWPLAFKDGLAIGGDNGTVALKVNVV